MRNHLQALKSKWVFPINQQNSATPMGRACVDGQSRADHLPLVD